MKSDGNPNVFARECPHCGVPWLDSDADSMPERVYGGFLQPLRLVALRCPKCYFTWDAERVFPR
jgi:hypothetical protein